MNLLKALGTIGSFTLASRILGITRDVLVARIFGAGMATDAFFVAIKLPNLLRRLFAEGAFSQAFVPILGEYKNRRGHEETKLLVDHVTTLLAIILFIVTLIGIIAAPILVYISAPGFVATPEKFDLTVQLLRIASPYIFFISLVAVASGILNTYNKFWVPAFTPILLNLCLIGAALWLAPFFDPPIMALAWAVFLAGFVQLAFQLPFLKKIGMLPTLRLNLKDAGVWRVIKQMGPAVFGVSISQISLIINTIFASFLVAGSVSWLYYADRLMEFPSGVLGAAIATILLPSLSKHHSDGHLVEYSKLLDWGLRLTFMLTLPAALALGMIAVPLLATFFQHGAFTAHDVLMTRNALVGYSVGLIGILSVKVLAPGFYARQDIRTPVKTGIITLLATQAMNLLFIGWLQHAGLALAIGLGSCLNSAILFYLLRKREIYQPEPGWGKFLAKLGAAMLVLGLTLWFGMGSEQSWLTSGGWMRIWRLTGLVVMGMTVYFAVLWMLGFRLKDFSRLGA
ncbi:murein biosynthesis integral membrane protein MurJ [Candidatus Nitrotoga sp. 1052]|uniref:murein biosynthesis integral membrane protein MurJ n=1 Tax=Candidatus Nitrotoga sp. 1052 TaxID=2886964 RepID=UPI001EF51697|nr:murein biosynthesis integral membrane protein MurJ [Candidatus Nitrotoga sp. 1052]CAH1075794.1 lipid II flippase MurJ [Candidatus Nitrotoga sp. 1052]